MDDPRILGEFAVWYVVFLFTLTFHEAGHALVARLGGDDTAYQGGQVSLNPLPHIRRELFGTVLFPVLTFFTSGWMMGWASTPFDPRWGQKHPRRLAAMSAAGPTANLLLAAAVFIVLKMLVAASIFAAPERISFSRMVVPVPGTPEESVAWPLAFFLSVALNLNVLLCLFNLIPLPPLDGAGILQGLLPGSVGPLFERMTRNPMIAIFGLILSWQVIRFLYPPAVAVILALLHPNVAYS